MVKLKATRDFTLAKFNEITIIKRKDRDIKGWVYNEDVFECNEEMAKYLTGNNDNKIVVAEILEVEPVKEEIKEEVKEEVKVEKTKKKKTKKAKFDF